MGSDNTDKIAFSAIMGLTILTGVVTYYIFGIYTPKTGIVDSIYRKDLPPASAAGAATTAKAAPIDESKFTNKVSVSILAGANTQGNPSFGPNPAKASSDALVTWTNDDTTPHTITSGTGPQDPDSGKLFDSGIIPPHGKFSVPAEKIGKGDHSYYCSVHPFMQGKITIS